MASSLYSVVLGLAIVSAIVAPTSSTSRGTLLHHGQKRPQPGLRVVLEQVDSGMNLTKYELIKRAIKRGERRMRSINAMLQSSSGIETPVYAGSGEYLMNVAIGTPASSFSAIMDTGSDLIWTQCEPCTQCFSQPTPIFNPQDSSSFSTLPCESQYCQDLPSETCYNNDCQYTYGYGDGSSTQGYMATETFTFETSSVPNIAFGCGDNNQGFGQGNGAGLIGMGWGPLSLPSQLGVGQFSYCMTSYGSSSPSTLALGSAASGVPEGSPSTTLIHSSSNPTYYYITLQGITVGGDNLGIPSSTFQLQDDGTGGMIIDSGTTLTYLPQDAYNAVAQAFTDQINLSTVDESSSGLSTCFQQPSDGSTVQVPEISMQFDGGVLNLGEENVLISPAEGVICLAMGSSSQLGISILGNIQQQETQVLYDLQNLAVSFVPAQCGAS
uniref:nepenthesin n=1 Tax=Nepenthes copelandii TaxID=1100689 RepID=A0A0S3TFL5_9CARY|nr:nepenthesin II [Nepenthes copelandii]